MVDRPIIYTGALPQTVDVLNAAKMGMVGLAYLCHGVLGTGTVVEGLQCTPTTPTPDLNVHVNVGSIYAIDETDATAYSDLGIDTTNIVKQGILNVAKSFAITPPATGGFSQVYLIEAALTDVDAGATVLSYFNAANPAAPYSGPANNGMSQFTTRTCVCQVSLKAGVAASTGSQVTPAPDAGFIGLYAITVANGQTQITSPNIVQLSTAPFFPTLPAVPADVQDCAWTYAVDTSTGGAALATTATTATSSAVLTFASVPAFVTAGMKAFDLTTVGAITGGQTVLSKTSTTVTLTGNVNATVGSGDLIAFSNNALLAAVSPPPAALVQGLSVQIKSAGTNSGATTFNLNGLGAVAIHRANGAALSAGDLTVGQVIDLTYDGSFWQVCNFNGNASGGSGSTTTINIPYCVDTSTVANAITAPFTPVISSLFAGLTVEVKIANANTGATTITVNALAAQNIVDSRGQALTYGALVPGMVAFLIYDGTNFQIANKATQALTTNVTFYVSNNTSGGVVGSDTLYDGTSPTISGTHGPWATLQGAANNIAQLNLNGFTATVNVASGTYSSFSATIPFTGPVSFVGNAGNPSLCTISGSSGAASARGTGVSFTLNGFTLTAPTGSAILAQAQAQIFFQNITFGSAVVHIGCDQGFVSCLGSYTISASAQFHVSCKSAGGYTLTPSTSNTITLTGVPNFSGAFATVFDQAYIRCSNLTFFNGTATGTRFSVATSGLISTGGAGASFLPGNLPGTQNTQGLYA